MSGINASSSDLLLMREVVLKAGDIGMSFFDSSVEKWTKGDSSPVTEADLAIDRFLKTHLLDARPDYGWRSEEDTQEDGQRDEDAVFIVDPIDGTRGFIGKDARWAVSIALVRNRRPVAAALYQPVTQTLYLAEVGKGATKNDEAIEVLRPNDLDGLEIAGPKALFKHPLFQASNLQRTDYIPSLALRIAYVGDGTLGAALAAPNCNEWDVAAADLIINEAGGKLLSSDGEVLLYNQAKSKQPDLIAACDELQAPLRDLLKQAR